MDCLSDTSSDEIDVDAEAQLRAALQFAVGNVLRDEASKPDGIPALGSTVATLTHMTFLYSKAMARDLKIYAKHAKRNVINTDDVKLIAARNDGGILKDLEKYELEHCHSTTKAKPNKNISAKRKLVKLDDAEKENKKGYIFDKDTFKDELGMDTYLDDDSDFSFT